jgi:hypothetical protein
MRCCVPIIVTSVMTTLVMTIAPVARAQVAVVRDAIPPPPPPPVADAAVVVEEYPSEVSLAGQVVRTKQVEVRGSNEKFLVALLDTGDGQREVVDLGPTANFRATPLYTGDQISLRGVRSTLGRFHVVLATQVNIGGDLVAIKRVVPPAFSAAVTAPTGYPVAERMVRIDGRIENLRAARLSSSRQEHVVAEVVTRNGRALVVDLGPPSALWRADVKQGEWITIQGQEMNVRNRPVLLALEINKNGIPHLIDRDLVRSDAAVVERTTVPDPATRVVDRQVAP